MLVGYVSAARRRSRIRHRIHIALCRAHTRASVSVSYGHPTFLDRIVSAAFDAADAVEYRAHRARCAMAERQRIREGIRRARRHPGYVKGYPRSVWVAPFLFAALSFLLLCAVPRYAYHRIRGNRP